VRLSAEVLAEERRRAEKGGWEGGEREMVSRRTCKLLWTPQWTTDADATTCCWMQHACCEMLCDVTVARWDQLVEHTL
jgi:hypothetical protein